MIASCSLTLQGVTKLQWLFRMGRSNWLLHSDSLTQNCSEGRSPGVLLQMEGSRDSPPHSCFLPSDSIPGKAEVSHQILSLDHWLSSANRYLPTEGEDAPWGGTN